MKRLTLVLWVILGFAIGEAVYHAGRQSIRRECPADQRGAKLLYSEQRSTGTVCTYASGWDGYGRTLKRKRP